MAYWVKRLEGGQNSAVMGLPPEWAKGGIMS